MTGCGIDRMVPAIHAADVVRLLAEVGTDPPHVRDPDALARDRRDAAQRIIRWCPSPERLARWVVVVGRRYAPRNVAGYLRRAAEHGDPGTLLAQAGHGERMLGVAAERALRGERADDVARLVGGGVAVLANIDLAERARLRDELRLLLAANRPAAARAVLLQLVGNARDDMAIARAIGDACSVAQAKELLVA